MFDSMKKVVYVDVYFQSGIFRRFKVGRMNEQELDCIKRAFVAGRGGKGSLSINQETILNLDKISGVRFFKKFW